METRVNNNKKCYQYGFLIIFMNNYAVFLSPILAQRLPEGSKKKALSLLALRKLWHLIFDLAPTTVQLLQDTTRPLNNFLTFAHGKHYSMNWTLHLYLLDWLYHDAEFRQKLKTPIILELMSAAALRWSVDVMSYPRVKGILLATSYSEKIVIGCWRSKTAWEETRLIRVSMPSQYFPVIPAYAISYEYDVWGIPQWNALP